MKKVFFLFAIMMSLNIGLSQVPSGFNYQAVVRDDLGELTSNKFVSFRFSVIAGAASGTVLYQELHGTSTTHLGLVTLSIGQGAVVKGDFLTIDWANGPYFLRVEMDLAGGNNFTSLGAFQMLSVPFAMHAAHALQAENAVNAEHAINVENVDDADADPTNEIQSLSLVGDTLSISGANKVKIPISSGPGTGESLWSARGNDIYYNDGLVGINTRFPGMRLEIKDTLLGFRSNSLYTGTRVLPESNGFVRAIYGDIFGSSDKENPTHRGVQGSSYVSNTIQDGANLGVAGFADLGHSNYGVLGRAGEDAGNTNGYNTGVYGLGESSSFVNRGVAGFTGGTGRFNQGVFGRADGEADNSSVYNAGVYGRALNHAAQNFGVLGYTTGTSPFNVGVMGEATGSDSTAFNYGIYAIADNGGTNYAGFFVGDVYVSGNLSKSGGTFKIDHPLDPAHKYLVHSFVESPDMMNVYNGNVMTDEKGYAVVELPAYFEAANKNFKYQLTVIGVFAQAIIAEKLKNNRFTIQTDIPNIEVSWQITGVRNDPWARNNRVVPELKKNSRETGRYLHPELYGKSEDEGMRNKFSHKGGDLSPEGAGQHSTSQKPQK